MARNAAASLSTLPVEMLHRVFDELDGTTIILSVRDVCQSLRAAIDTYDRYALDFTSLSQPDFHRLLPLIRPECVIALTLSNQERISGQMALFTRLRSLTLLDINHVFLSAFLRHARKCSLTSFTLRHRAQRCELPNLRELLGHLSSIIGQPTLLRLELLSDALDLLIHPLEWPSRSPLRFLRVACDTRLPLSKILDRLPDLKTLVLHDKSVSRNSFPTVFDEVSSAFYPRLTSLTISHTNLLPNYVQALLSHSPSLAYLKITGFCDLMIDGTSWEVLIKTKLLALNTFEFHQISRRIHSDRETSETLLNRVIASFRTPFWTEEKRWLVLCTWHPDDPSIEMCTSLVSTSNYLPSWYPNTLTVTNFARQSQYYTKHEDVLRLQLTFCGTHHFEDTVSSVNDFFLSLPSDEYLLSLPNQSIVNHLFPNVATLSILCDRWNSSDSVPVGLNLLNVTKLSLVLSYTCPANKVILDDLKSLLRQTPNIHSLEFSERFIRHMDQHLIGQICLVVVRCVDPLKLRHLTIPVSGVNHVQQLLSGFGDLLSLKFDIRGTRAEFDEIVKHLLRLTSDYSIEQDDSSSIVKMNRRLAPRNSSKRTKVDRSSDLKRKSMS